MSTATASKKKFWSGQVCPKSGTYGQYRDTYDNTYAGKEHDRYVYSGSTFPPSLNNHHFEEK